MFFEILYETNFCYDKFLKNIEIYIMNPFQTMEKPNQTRWALSVILTKTLSWLNGLISLKF